MRERTNIQLSATDRNDWRAKIVLLTADGHGTAEIIRATGKAKTVIWRWQERFGEEGVAGLWRSAVALPRSAPQRVRPPLGSAAEYARASSCRAKALPRLPRRTVPASARSPSWPCQWPE